MAESQGKKRKSIMNPAEWMELIFHHFTDAEIKILAGSVKPSIAGFKNSTKAPAFMLRKHTIEKLKMTSNPIVWVRTLYNSILGEYEDTSFDEFCYSARSKPDLTISEILVVTGTIYTAEWDKYQALIQANIDQQQHPLTGLAEKKITFKREIELKTDAWTDRNAEAHFLSLFTPRNPSKKVDESLKDWLKNEKNAELGEAAALAILQDKQWRKWGPSEKAAFLELAFKDSQRFLKLLHTEWEQDKAEQARSSVNLGKQLESRRRRMESDQEQLLQAKAYAARLETELAEKTALLESAQKELAALGNSRAQLAMQVETLEAAGQQIPSRPDNPLLPDLITESGVLVLTAYASEDYEGLMSARQILTLAAPDGELDLSGLDEADPDIIFIHSDTFSTRAQLELDRMLSDRDCLYRFVGGDLVAAARKMICYVEGDWANEG